MDNPIKIINERASTLTEDDVEWLVSELLDHYSGKIHSLSTYAYGSEKGIALAAFKEWSAKTLKKGLETFLFKNEHWRSGRSIGPYLSKCLQKLAESLKTDSDFVKKVSIPICPACKTLGEREYLAYEGKLLRCPTCTKEHERLKAQTIKSSQEEYEFRIRKVFSLHSRKGHRCPGCERFIPESFVTGNDRISCPYDNCLWFGIPSELEPMAHPLGQSSGVTVSMNAPIDLGDQSGHLEMQDLVDSNDINPDVRIEQEEKYWRELKIVRSVIETQMARLSNQPKSIKKVLMYRAFQILLEQDQAGMMNYLIHGNKAIGDRPIQSVIFQKYISLVENSLPMTINGEEVYSLLDKNLDIFLGESEFFAHVRESGLVSNNTHEVFDGAKCKGPCFIGMLCDVQDEDGNSIMSDVEYYTFSNVKMKSHVPANKMVKVIHFRIPPHYEMYSLVNLQRVRKKIVDSIYKRIHGKTRPLKGQLDERDKIIPEISR